MGVVTELDAEDTKLVVLARATRARTGAVTGAALRDLDGRTYAAAEVSLSSLSISAIGVCVAMAISSGAKGAEALVLLGADTLPASDLAVVVEFAGRGVPVYVGDARGTITDTTTS